MWNEALNQVGVDDSSTLRRAENVFYPLAIQTSSPSSFKAESALKYLNLSKDASANALPSSTIPYKKVDHNGVVEKTAKEVVSKPTKLPPSPSKEKGVSQSQKLVLVTLPFTAKEDPKGKGTTQAIVPEYQRCSQGQSSSF